MIRKLIVLLSISTILLSTQYIKTNPPVTFFPLPYLPASAYVYDSDAKEVVINPELLRDTLKNLREHHANWPNCIDELIFNAKTGLIAARHSTNTIEIWELKKNKNLEFVQAMRDEETSDIAFSPDGNFLTYHALDPNHIKLLRRNADNSFSISQIFLADSTENCIGGYSSIAFDADGTTMVAVHTLPSEDLNLPDICNIRVFMRQKDQSFKLVQEIPVNHCLPGCWMPNMILSPDGTRLAYYTSEESAVTLLARTKDNSFEFYKKIPCDSEDLSEFLKTTHQAQYLCSSCDGNIDSISFSPDGTQLAIGLRYTRFVDVNDQEKQISTAIWSTVKETWSEILP